jgi:Tol biopolymer transport system component
MKKEMMYCRNCGKPVPMDSKFCQRCGTALAQTTTAAPQEPKLNPAKTIGLSRKYIILGIIAVLVLTAVCSPLVLFGRSEILKSVLNPDNRSVPVQNTPDSLITLTTPSSAEENNQETTRATDPAPAAASPELNYPDSPMVFASDRDDPNFEECSQTGSCWTQVFYTPSGKTGSPINLTMPLGFSSASYPSLSPDGTKVAFTGFMAGGKANHIYVVNINGSGLKKVSQDSYTHMYPSWAPDNTHLVYMSRPETGTFFNLFIADIKSSQIRQLSSGDYMDRFPSWSPDGKFVAFHTNREDPNPAACWPDCLLVIYVINAETSKGGPTQDDGNLISGGAVDWSPDGKQLAFHSNRDGNWNIYLMQQDGSVSQLSDDPGDELFPRWSPDGNFISYTSQTANGFDIAVTPADHFEPEYYFSGTSRDLDADW